MKMHKTFTRIPQRSYNAFVGRRKQTLDAVLAALAVDPLEAEDAFKMFGVKETKHSLEHFAGVSRLAFVSALETISQWVKTVDVTVVAIYVVAEYDARLGTWCACQVARESLRFVPEGRSRASDAIKCAEGWVRGSVHKDKCYWAAEEAVKYFTESSSTRMAELAASDTAYAAFHSKSSYDASRLCREVVDDVAEAYATSANNNVSDPASSAWRAEKARSLVRLRDVIADACLSYPVIP